MRSRACVETRRTPVHFSSIAVLSRHILTSYPTFSLSALIMSLLLICPGKAADISVAGFGGAQPRNSLGLNEILPHSGIHIHALNHNITVASAAVASSAFSAGGKLALTHDTSGDFYLRAAL